MEKVKEMIEDGFAIKRIASLLDLKFQDVKRLVEKNGWELKKEEFNEEKIKYIINLYKSGVSAKQLGKKFSIDKRRVQRWAKEKNLLRDRNESHRFTEFNQNIFDNINNEDKAYWLGFFYADAYNSEFVNTVTLALKGSDFKHLIKLANFIELPEDKVIRKVTNNGDDICYLKMYSKYLCSKLSEIGCPQAKSFIIKYPEWLDSKFHSHFIRGLFDGDGCLTFRKKQKEWKWSLTSTKECCESIKSIIKKEINININYYYISKTNNNTYDLETAGNEKIRNILDWIYTKSNDRNRLSRKYSSYIKLCNQQDNRSFLKNTNRKNYILTSDQKFDTKNTVSSNMTNLKNRKKIWEGPIDFPGHNFIENNPKTIKADEFLIYEGNKLSFKYLKTIDEDQRDEIAKSIFNFFKQYDFNRFEFDEEKIKKAWKALQKYEPKIEEIDGVKYVNNAGTSGYQIYRHYFPNLIKVKGAERPSIYDVVTDDEKLWKTIRNRIGNTLLYHPTKEARQWPMNQSISSIIIGAKNSGLASMSSIFKPTVAKAIYQQYVSNGDNILDYSCGFGTRLLGLMSCGFRDVKYCGYEPNKETYNNLLKLIKDFKFNAEIKCCGSEEKNLFKENFNLIFSSPPYFDYERYSDEKTQCYNRYPKYEEWLEMYWRRTVQNMRRMLKKDGVFGINIGGKSNKFMQKLDKDLNEIIVEEGYQLIDTWWMKTSRSHLVSTKRGNPENRFKLEGIFFYMRK